MASREGEPMSPEGTMLHEPSLNCHVIVILGFKTTINYQVIREGVCQTLRKYPRFGSKLVKEGSKSTWIPTTVDLDKHIIVPEIDPNLEDPDRFVEDYVANFTKTPLDMSKPLWELHLLNIKTSDANGVGVFRMHHSIGDGATIMSFLLANARKTSNPSELPTVPTQKRNTSKIDSSPFWWLLAIWWGLVLIWNTMVDLLLFTFTVFFIKDTPTPVKGAPGVEFNHKRFVHRTVSMDDIKLIKNEMKTTINDVLLGITQAALTRYLNRAYDMDTNSYGAKRRFGFLKKILLRALVMVNVRSIGKIQNVADMTVEGSKFKWGNQVGYMIFPFSIALEKDPLEYVRKAKATIDRKKHSLEASCSFSCMNLVFNLFGVKVVAAMTHRIFSNTTVSFSNMPGPVEEISFYGHPLAYIVPTVYGLPHALTIHLLSYANKMIISLAVDPLVIPDPYLLCDDLEHSLKLIHDAVQRKNTVDVV